MKSTQRIAIIGAGPGGLTLARLLHLQGMEATVFEREAHPLERPQGGSLDLHEDTGLLALERAGLREPFSIIARYEDQGTRLYDKSGVVLFDDQAAASGTRPEVDRTALRALLLNSIPPEGVRWGHSLRSLQDRGNGQWDLVFEHSTEGPFNWVVGADGTWSRVRPLLSAYQPQYSGLCFVEFAINDIDNAHPELAGLVGRGKMGVEGDGKALIVQRNGHAHVRGYAIFRVPLGWVENRFDFNSPQAMREGLAKEFTGFANVFLDLFHASSDDFAVRPIYALPVGHAWVHRPGLTLLGDAAHVMSPFGGDGVNNAMFDAVELASVLSQHPQHPAAVADYERLMFGRVAPSAQGAADGAATFLSHDGQALTVAMYKSHQDAASTRA